MHITSSKYREREIYNSANHTQTNHASVMCEINPRFGEIFYLQHIIFKTITQSSLFFIYVRTHRARSDLNTCTHEI
jgi:hypothetical protein